MKEENQVQIDIEATERIMPLYQAQNRQIFAVRQNDGIDILVTNNTTDEQIKSLQLPKDEQYRVIRLSKDRMDELIRTSFRPALIKQQELLVENGQTSNTNKLSADSDARLLHRTIIETALDMRASDIHIIPTSKCAYINFRIDGKIMDFTKIPLSVCENLRNILISDAAIPEVKPYFPIDGKSRFTYKNRQVDIRISVIPCKFGSDINIRLLNNENINIGDMGMNRQQQSDFLHLMNMTKGLIIITGPTGSGKSTTLHAGLMEIMNDDGSSQGKYLKNICTAENPVELTLEGATQVDINESVGFTYTKAVKAFLRHDPDIIVVGEIRTLEEAEEAVRAANTGHLVLTTLHTNDAVSAIARLVTLGLNPISFCNCLAAIVAQRLVRRICPHCSETYELNANCEWRKKFNLGNEKIVLKRGKGCDKCNHTGYFGRVMISEILLPSDELRYAVETGKSLVELKRILHNENFETMVKDGVNKALEHITTLDEMDRLIGDVV